MPGHLAIKNAALFIADKEAKSILLSEALKLVKDEKRIRSLSQNIGNFAYINSAEIIAEEIYKIVNK